MDLMEIKQTQGKAFSIEIRDHKVITDMHKEDGGGDIGMNPLELMVAHARREAEINALMGGTRDSGD